MFTCCVCGCQVLCWQLRPPPAAETFLQVPAPAHTALPMNTKPAPAAAARADASPEPPKAATSASAVGRPPAWLLPKGTLFTFPCPSMKPFLATHYWPHAWPLTETVRALPGYVASINLRTRIPNFVIETLTASTVHGPADRKHSRFMPVGLCACVCVMLQLTCLRALAPHTGCLDPAHVPVN